MRTIITLIISMVACNTVVFSQGLDSDAEPNRNYAAHTPDADAFLYQKKQMVDLYSGAVHVNIPLFELKG